MDTSETYIKMCEKAEKIQLLRREKAHVDTGKWKDGDIYAHITGGISMAYPSYLDIWASEPDYLHHPHENIWLPRQDQLQAMVDPYKSEQNSEWHSKSKTYDLLRVFLAFCTGDEYEMSFPTSYVEQFTSMEQLWFAFVMSQLYKKQWNAETWKVI